MRGLFIETSFSFIDKHGDVIILYDAEEIAWLELEKYHRSYQAQSTISNNQKKDRRVDKPNIKNLGKKRQKITRPND